MNGDTCDHGNPADVDCEECSTARAEEARAQMGPVGNAADAFLARMRFAAIALLKKPEREMTADEMALFVNGAMALAEMFMQVDEKLSTGHTPPTDWLPQGFVTANGVPASEQHEQLKGELEHAVMLLIKDFESIGKKTSARLCLKLGQLMVLNGRFTQESVRIATLHNVTVEGGAPRLEVVRDEEEPEPVTKKGRSADLE